jgi:hypothetical protein
MSKPTIREHNIETNQVIDREMSDAEFVIYQTEQAKHAAAQAEAAAKEHEKSALFAKLGITEDEAKLLLS